MNRFQYKLIISLSPLHDVTIWSVVGISRQACPPVCKGNVPTTCMFNCTQWTTWCVSYPHDVLFKSRILQAPPPVLPTKWLILKHCCSFACWAYIVANTSTTSTTSLAIVCNIVCCLLWCHYWRSTLHPYFVDRFLTEANYQRVFVRLLDHTGGQAGEIAEILTLKWEQKISSAILYARVGRK